jgi:2-methylcitrate dehydratase PrpD
MLTQKISEAIAKQTIQNLPEEVLTKLKFCFMEALTCMFEGKNLPHCQNTIATFQDHQRCDDLAFIYGVLAHSLVREDMHTGSVSHLGVVIFPALMAMAQQQKISGADFLLAATCGYETGTKIGQKVMVGDIPRIHRPTGVTGPIAATTALSKAANISQTETVSALGIAVNTCAGFNEWAEFGADDMYMHVGYAARNSLTAIQLAKSGIRASETALEGKAGLFAALSLPLEYEDMQFFDNNTHEVMQVFFKPSPSCNYTQTPNQVALQLVETENFDISDIKAIKIYCTDAAISYPGCDGMGPFKTNLQAKMSIAYSVASTLYYAKIADSNYHMPADENAIALVEKVQLIPDQSFTAAYPAEQGSRIELLYKDGKTVAAELADLVPATLQEVADRFVSAATACLGETDANSLKQKINELESIDDMQVLLKVVNRGLF